MIPEDEWQWHCPECNADWRDKPIPVEYLERGLYGEWNGEPRYYSRLIGIYNRDRDRTEEWMCPDCETRWPRD